MLNAHIWNTVGLNVYRDLVETEVVRYKSIHQNNKRKSVRFFLNFLVKYSDMVHHLKISKKKKSAKNLKSMFIETQRLCSAIILRILRSSHKEILGFWPIYFNRYHLNSSFQCQNVFHCFINSSNEDPHLCYYYIQVGVCFDLSRLFAEYMIILHCQRLANVFHLGKPLEHIKQRIVARQRY